MLYAGQASKAQEVQSLEARLLGSLAAAPGPGAPWCRPPGPLRARIKELGAGPHGASGKRSRAAGRGTSKPPLQSGQQDGRAPTQPADESCVLHENSLFDDGGGPAAEIAAARESESVAAAVREAGLERLERRRAEEALQEVWRKCLFPTLFTLAPCILQYGTITCVLRVGPDRWLYQCS